MKAIVAQALGPPETFAIEDLAARALGPDDLRIAVHFAGVSFVDVLTATGGYQVKPPTPFIPGSEFSGVVLETGSAVTGFAPGDRVAAGGFGGIFAEEVVVPARSANRIPENAPMAEAAVLRASYLTAGYALVHRARLQAGETVLVLGAGGAVGIAAVQIAVAHGAVIIASASSDAKRALALASGAAHAVDSGAADWRDEIKRLTDGRGVDVVVDPLGDLHTERAFRALRWNGRHLVVGFAAGEIPRLPTNLALLKGGSLIGIDLRQVGEKEPDLLAAVSKEVFELFAAGRLRPPVARAYAFEDFIAAMQAAAKGDSAGRILLQMPAAGRA
jgi:NADPH2:quinone reductase